MTKDYGEIICTAVDEIVRARISSLEFNVTKTCTIIDISSRKQGKYGVSDGSVSFIALSEDTTYNLDDSVLVLIPNGDYKNDKLILSKINKDTELPYNYTSPMSMMVTLTDNVLDSDKYGKKVEVENNGLLANEPAAADGKIGTSIVLYELTKNLDQLNGFTRIGLSVDFKALLNNLNVHSGTYGIFIEIHSKAGEQGAEKDLATILPFDCNEMAGNPYNFTSFFTQEKVFDISYIQNIQSIQVVFYQGADFKDAQGEPVPYQYTEFPSNEVKNYNNNLFASNVKMYFGQGVNEFDKETITLYTNDVPSYHYTRDNEKILNIRWVHKVNDNTYTPLSGIGLDTSKYEVRWYRYNSATTNIDEYAGESWESIGGLAANTFSIKFTPDTKNIKEKIKVIGIVRDGSVVSHSSNILELTNEEYVPDQAVFDVSDGLSIGCLDDTSGNYFLYDQNGYLNNSGLGLEYMRSLAPLWKGKQIDYDTFPGEVVDYIQWWFPANHTMIVCNEETANIQTLNGTTYKVFEYRPTIDWDKNNLVFDYSIKGYWAKTEANNTIRCVLSKNGVEYTAIKELQFGRAGSNGTNLTMVLEFMNGGNALVLDTSEIINYQQELEHLLEEMQTARLKDDKEFKEQIEIIKKTYGKKLLHYSNNQKYQSAMQALQNTLNCINDDYANDLYENQIAYEIALAEAEWHCYAQLLQQSSHEQYEIMLKLMYQELQLLDTKYHYGEFQSEEEYQKQVSELKARYYEQLAQFSSQMQYQNTIQDMATALSEIEEAYNNAVIEHQADYEKLIQAMEQQYCQMLSQSSCFGLGVEARLYDSNGSRIDFTADQAAKIEWTWFKKSDTDYMIYNINQILNEDANGTHNDSSVTINWNSDIVLPATLPIDNYFILQATYKEDTLSPGITAFLPIPIKTINCSHIEGAKEVIYNHQGIPSYYRDAYKAFAYIYDEQTNKWIYDEFKDKNKQSISWRITVPNEDRDNSELPILKQLSKSDNHVALSAPQFFVQDQNDKLCVSCAYWSQPILIMQSRYDFETLNSWDESLTIDENNGILLSTMLGAGKKVGNVFSGVLIGDLQGGLGYQATERHTGVYGFSDGQMSFGFRDDGTAFIGKSGKGQILFDGNQGTIKSNNIDLTVTIENDKEVRTISGTGLLLDMDDAHVSIHGEVVKNSKKTYFDVWRNNKELIHISDGGYYLQSAEYEIDGSGKGFKIDLESGLIDANTLYLKTNNFLLNSTGNSEPYFQIRDDHNPQHVLFNAAPGDYYLQSCGYESKQGMRIDLTHNQFNAYNFTLHGENSDAQSNYAGSYLEINSEPSIVVHIKDKSKNYDIDLLNVSTTNFLLQSHNWYDGDDGGSSTTITMARVTASSLHVRKGPSVSYGHVAYVSNGDTFQVYGEENGWYSLSPTNSKNEDDSQWASGDYLKIYDQTIDSTPYAGMQIDVADGTISMYKTSAQALLIDSTAAEYPFQIGVLKNGKRNFRVGWDGSVSGGSSYDWSIAANGKATFKSLEAKGGTFNGWINASGGSIGGWTLSDGQLRTKWNGYNISTTPSFFSVPVYVTGSGNTAAIASQVVTSVKTKNVEISISDPNSPHVVIGKFWLDVPYEFTKANLGIVNYIGLGVTKIDS